MQFDLLYDNVQKCQNDKMSTKFYKKIAQNYRLKRNLSRVITTGDDNAELHSPTFAEQLLGLMSNLLYVPTQLSKTFFSQSHVDFVDTLRYE